MTQVLIDAVAPNASRVEKSRLGKIATAKLLRSSFVCQTRPYFRLSDWQDIALHKDGATVRGRSSVDQSSSMAAVNLCNCSSVWNGPGVTRMRSAPTGTVG